MTLQKQTPRAPDKKVPVLPVAPVAKSDCGDGSCGCGCGLAITRR